MASNNSKEKPEVSPLLSCLTGCEQENFQVIMELMSSKLDFLPFYETAIENNRPVESLLKELVVEQYPNLPSSEDTVESQVESTILKSQQKRKVAHCECSKNVQDTSDMTPEVLTGTQEENIDSNAHQESAAQIKDPVMSPTVVLTDATKPPVFDVVVNSNTEHSQRLVNGSSDCSEAVKLALDTVKNSTNDKPCAIENYVLWPNRDAFCWLNSSMSLLLHSKTLKTYFAHHQDTNCHLEKIFKNYWHLNSQANERILSGDIFISGLVNVQLEKIQNTAFEFLQRSQRCIKGQPDSPIFAIQLLLKERPDINRLFSFEHWWSMMCDSCSSVNHRKSQKTVVSCSKIENSFSMTNPIAKADCRNCCRLDQKRILQYEKLPNSLILHFLEGLPLGCLISDLDFEFLGSNYLVVGLIQYTVAYGVNHFVTWIRNPQTDEWLNCDDLRSGMEHYSSKGLLFPCSEVHMVMWEKMEIKTLEKLPSCSKTAAPVVVEPTNVPLITIEDSDIPSKSEGQTPLKCIKLEPISGPRQPSLSTMQSWPQHAVRKLNLPAFHGTDSFLSMKSTENICLSPSLFQSPSKPFKMELDQVTPPPPVKPPETVPETSRLNEQCAVNEEHVKFAQSLYLRKSPHKRSALIKEDMEVSADMFQILHNTAEGVAKEEKPAVVDLPNGQSSMVLKEEETETGKKYGQKKTRAKRSYVKRKISDEKPLVSRHGRLIKRVHEEKKPPAKKPKGRPKRRKSKASVLNPFVNVTCTPSPQFKDCKTYERTFTISPILPMALRSKVGHSLSTTPEIANGLSAKSIPEKESETCSQQNRSHLYTPSLPHVATMPETLFPKKTRVETLEPPDELSLSPVSPVRSSKIVQKHLSSTAVTLKQTPREACPKPTPVTNKGKVPNLSDKLSPTKGKHKSTTSIIFSSSTSESSTSEASYTPVQQPCKPHGKELVKNCFGSVKSKGSKPKLSKKPATKMSTSCTSIQYAVSPSATPERRRTRSRSRSVSPSPEPRLDIFQQYNMPPRSPRNLGNAPLSPKIQQLFKGATLDNFWT